MFVRFAPKGMENIDTTNLETPSADKAYTTAGRKASWTEKWVHSWLETVRRSQRERHNNVGSTSYC